MLKQYCLPHNLSLGAPRAPNTYNKEKKNCLSMVKSGYIL